MRKKALLIGALSSFEGPRVSLEEGEWVIAADPPLETLLVGVEIDGKVEVSPLMEEVVISGPCRVFARVEDSYDGPGIHLDARQVR